MAEWRSARAIVAQMRGKPIMPTDYVPGAIALKVGYFFLGALVLVFVGMLLLTVMHP